MSSIRRIAPGTVIVISRMGTPPARIASMARPATSGDSARITGTRPTSRICARTSCLLMPCSARHPGGAPLHDPLHLGQGGHGRVAGRGHGERPVGRSAIHRPLGSLAGEEPVNEAGGEGVATPDTIVDLQVLPVWRLVEPPLAVADRAPVVEGGGLGVAQRRGHRREVRERLHRLLDHLPESAGVEGGEILVEALHREAEGGREVLLVAEHDVHQGRQLPVHLLGPLLSPDRLPEGGAVVQVVGDDGAVAAGRGHRLPGHEGSGLGEGGEDPPGVEPAGSLLAEDRLPIDLPRLELRDRGVAAVRAADSGAHAEAALGEVEAVPGAAAHPVVLDPAQVRRVDPALVDQVLDQAAHRVVDEGGHDRGVEAEAALQPARDVVLPPALRDLEGAGGVDAAVSGVQPQHDFAQAHEVPSASFAGPGRERAHTARRYCAAWPLSIGGAGPVRQSGDAPFRSAALRGGTGRPRPLVQGMDAPRPSGQPPARLHRHPAPGPPGLLRLRRCPDAGPGRAGQKRPALHPGHHRRPPHPPRALLPAHGDVPRPPRRARQRRLLPRRGADPGRGAAGEGLPHRRLRGRVRPGLALGDRPGLRPVLRRLRPLALRGGGDGRGAAARRRSRGEGPRVAGRGPGAAVPGLGPPLRSPHALRPAGALPLALSPHFGGRLRRRDRVERRARGPAAQRAARGRPARANRGGGGGRPRRVPGGAPGADPRLLRLRRDRPHSDDRGRSRGTGPHRHRAGAHRGRDAHRPRPPRAEGAGGRPGPEPPAPGPGGAPGPRGDLRELVPPLPLRLERAQGPAGRPLQAHRRPAARAVRPGARPRRDRRRFGGGRRARRGPHQGAPGHPGRRDEHERHEGTSLDRSRCGGAPAGPGLPWRRGEPAQPGGAPARRPQGQDRPLQPPETGRAILGRGTGRRGDRGGARRAAPGPRDRRRPPAPRQLPEQGRPARRGGAGVPPGPGPRPGASGGPVQPGPGLQEDGPPGGCRGGFRAGPAARPPGHETPVAARGPRDAPPPVRAGGDHPEGGPHAEGGPSLLPPQARRVLPRDEALGRGGEAAAGSLGPPPRPGGHPLQPRPGPRGAGRGGLRGGRLRRGPATRREGLPLGLQPGASPGATRQSARGDRPLPRGPGGPARVRNGRAVPGQGAARHGRPARGGGGGAPWSGPEARASGRPPRPLRAGRRLHPPGSAGGGRPRGRGRAADGEGRVTRARLAVLALLGAACGRSPEARPTPRHLVLVTIDTLRADRLGCYGSTSVATPNLDRLAREGALAEDATVHVPLTRPSHVTIFTGLYPAEHGVRDNVSPSLAPAVPVLAEVLQKSGFATAAFVSSIVVSRQSGLARGFETYSDRFQVEADDARFLDQIQRRGDGPTAEAIAWLEAPRAGRRFVWLHLYDPHEPYEPPEPYASRYAGRPYDGEVAWSDELVGRLDAALERVGLGKDTLLVVTSDHGEGLGEHGEEAHGYFVYEATLRVPLLARGPGVPPGTRVPTTFRSVDLLPTLLDVLGVPPPAGARFSGRSLAGPLRGGPEPASEPTYAESLTPLLHYG